ncbi:MAG TPA: ABC transporter permease subunit [Ktedonobacteraceae bacterium]
MAHSIRLKDIAQEAQVSIGTVSRVFNNQGNVTEEVRQRVLKVASQLGYFGASEQEARVAANNRSVKDIGFLFCTFVTGEGIIANPFWSHILHGAESAASKFNVRVTYRSLSNLQNTPDLLLSTIYEMKLGGILLVGPAELSTIQLVQSTGIPLVLVDNYVSCTNAVLGNNFEGARAAVNYLIRMGHSQIAFIGGPLLDAKNLVNRVYTIEGRAEGYRMALVNAGLRLPSQLYEAANLSIDGGYEACKRLLVRDQPFSALYITFKNLGWIDTFLPILVPQLFGSAYSIFLYRQFFMALSRELDEAARVDGCGYLGIWWHVILPQSRPVVIVVAIFTFLYSWQDAWNPLIYLNSDQTRTVPLGLLYFSNGYTTVYPQQMAATVVALIVPVILYAIGQRYIDRGVAIAEVK